MKTLLKSLAVGLAAIALTGCNNYVYRVALDTPTAEDCARFAKLGDKAVKAGDKAKVAETTAITGSPLYAPLAAVAGAINVAVAGGEKVYELGVEKYDSKCR